MTKRDIVIISALLFAALATGLFNYFSAPGAKDYLTIIYKEEKLHKIKLPVNRKIEINAGGGYWLVEIKGFKARIADADCPGHDCIKQGWINKKGEALICVPQNFIARFEGEGDIDALTQ